MRVSENVIFLDSETSRRWKVGSLPVLMSVKYGVNVPLVESGLDDTPWLKGICS
jgi:hypothetical protein